MKRTRQQEREARKLLRFCVVGSRLDNGRARAVANTLLQTRRRGYVPLLKRFVHLLKYEHARYSAEIESAVPMPADLRALVLDRLIAAYGPTSTSSFVHNPDLIGGVRIKIGCDVYDGSVRSYLRSVASEFGIAVTNILGSTNGRVESDFRG